VNDLNLQNLREIDTEGDLFRFAGQCEIRDETGAMRLLRNDTVAHVGVVPVWTVRTQFGFAQAWLLSKNNSSFSAFGVIFAEAYEAEEKLRRYRKALSCVAKVGSITSGSGTSREKIP
jgi:hypothetical protein